MMDSSSNADEHFHRGVIAMDNNRYDSALEHFRAAQHLEPTSARYRSFYGLCLAIGERRFDQALELCRSAAREEFFNPALYRNLARVHLTFGFKAEGVRYLRRGLMIDPANEEIIRDLRELGERRRPSFGFLPRGHLVNRWLGIFRGRPGKAA